MKFSNSPSQKFSIVLNETLFNIEVNWNTRHKFWVMDIKDTEREFYGIKLVSGINILSPFPHFDFSMKCDELVDPSRFNLDSYEFVING